MERTRLDRLLRPLMQHDSEERVIGSQARLIADRARELSPDAPPVHLQHDSAGRPYVDLPPVGTVPDVPESIVELTRCDAGSGGWSASIEWLGSDDIVASGSSQTNEAGDWLRPDLVDHLLIGLLVGRHPRFAPVPYTWMDGERQIGEVWTGDRAAAIAAAVEYLEADEQVIGDERQWQYRDAETRQWYRVSCAQLAELGAAVLDGHGAEGDDLGD